jgi:transcriptional regulator with XRE-family HTH domain
MAIRDFTASSYVAAQVKNIRKRRRWSQQHLAERLSDLLTGPPPEMFEGDDPRRARAETRKALPRKWTQTRIAKLERGALKCVSVDDVLELALGLDVSPLVLMTPALPPPEEDLTQNWALLRPRPDDTFRVALGGIASWPHEVRQWIRGVNPLLGPLDYKNDADAAAGRRFYLLESQPLSEWSRIAESGDYAKRVRDLVTELVDEESEEEARG